MFCFLDLTIDSSVQPDDDPCNSKLNMDYKFGSFSKSSHQISLDNMISIMINVISNQSLFVDVMIYQPYDRERTSNELQRTENFYFHYLKNFSRKICLHQQAWATWSSSIFLEP